MKKIFFLKTADHSTSEQALKKILSREFKLQNPSIERNENGKPYLQNGKELNLHFSVSHTNGLTFFAFSDKNIGVDAENLSRKVNYAPIAKKFPESEQMEIRSTCDFLRHWTAKESAVKWLGGSLNKDLANLQFIDGQIHYKRVPLPICVCFLEQDGYLVCVCGENDFSNVTIEPFNL